MDKNTQETIEKLVENVKQSLKEELRAEITSRFEGVQKLLDFDKKSLFSMVETIQTTQNLYQKEMNMKIGGLRGKETKIVKEENILAKGVTLEEAEEIKKRMIAQH